jgi:DNA-binding transcriptional LysR family regulator
VSARSTPVELRHLRYFVAVADERHFGRAADRLGISQPGLSQQIKALERTVGRELLIRNRPMELTPSGELLLEQAREILDLVDRLEESIGVSGADVDRLRLGTFIAQAHPVADRVLEAFRARYPGVDVELSPGSAPQNLDALARKEIDAAFVHAPLGPGSQVSFLRLGGIEVVVALPEAHRLAALERLPREELLKETVISGPRSVNPGLSDFLFRSIFGEIPPRIVEVTDIASDTRLASVGRGVGVAAIAKNRDLEVPGIVFRSVEDPAPSLEYGIAWRDPPSAAAAALLEIGREHAEHAAQRA